MEALQQKIEAARLIYIEVEIESRGKIQSLFAGEEVEEPVTDVEYYYFGLYRQWFSRVADLVENYYQSALKTTNQLLMSTVNNYLAYYYRRTRVNFYLMKQHYLAAIELNNSDSMDHLANYYQYVEIDYNLMKHYYLLSIEQGNMHSMNNLGMYYFRVEQNFDLMKHYYLRAIELGNVAAMSNLGRYYQLNEINYDLMKEYLTKAAEAGNINAMYCLALYYRKTEVDHPLMKHYYLMGIRGGDVYSLEDLTKFYLRYEPSPEAFTFAVTHHAKKLLKKTYQPEYVHVLLSLEDEDLPSCLLKEKQTYVSQLFHQLLVNPTWFCPPTCVKDITEMVKLYITRQRLFCACGLEH